MSNPDRLLAQAQEHAETLIEDRGIHNALTWAIHCANRSTDGFWSRVVQIIQAYRQCDDCGEWKLEGERTRLYDFENFFCAACSEAQAEAEEGAAADRGDWEFHQRHDQ